MALSACRFEDLTPGSSRRDEAGIQATATGFYQALGTRDHASLEKTTLPAATVLVTAERTPVVLVSMASMIEIPERRNEHGGVRIVRVELHPDGDLATARVVIAARSADGRNEFEATDFLTMAHRTNDWRIAHAVFGPWRIRSAP